MLFSGTFISALEEIGVNMNNQAGHFKLIRPGGASPRVAELSINSHKQIQCN